MVQLAAFPKCYLDAIAHERSMTVFQWIEMAAPLDVDGLEMYDGFFTSRDPTYLDGIGEVIERAGFAMPMLCCSPDLTAPDASVRAREVEREVENITIARRLGGPGAVCRVLTGQRYPETPHERALGWVVEAIRELIPVARQHGVVLGLENHYKDGHWRYPEFAQRQEVFMEVLMEIGDDPNFGVQFDPSNAIVAGDDPIDLLDLVAQRVVSMHASDRHLVEGATLDDLRASEGSAGYAAQLAHGVIGEGLNDYPALFARLASVGYRGWVSIEDGMNGMQEIERSAAFLRVNIARAFGDDGADPGRAE
ncbi:sugar phosphate isomerase/epimerase [soil metagenome]